MTKKQMSRTVLERTVKEQEATILQLRSENTQLLAQNAALRKRGRKRPSLPVARGARG